jgi:chitinase
MDNARAIRIGLLGLVALGLVACAADAPSANASRPGTSNGGDPSTKEEPARTGPDTSGPTTIDVGDTDGTKAKLEVAGYYAGYTRQVLPPADIDATAFDTVVCFSAIPKPDGALDEQTNVLSAVADGVVAKAHAASKKATLSIGGAQSRNAFLAATTDAVRSKLVASIALSVKAHGYEGVDLDWEPLEVDDTPRLGALASDLRAALDALGAPKRTLSVAAMIDDGAIVAASIASIDRVHLMAYDLSGPYPGWITWHNAPLSAGDATFPTGGTLPSIESAVQAFVSAGVPASKLLLGIDHLGYVWKGVSEPKSAWTTAPTMTAITYRDIADELLPTNKARWDDVAQVPFLSLAGQFVSYDDAKSQTAKVAFARAKGLAGVFVWEISASYRPTRAAAERNALVTSLAKDARAE